MFNTFLPTEGGEPKGGFRQFMMIECEGKGK
jgi:hypothetical protein